MHKPLLMDCLMTAALPAGCLAADTQQVDAA